MASNSTRRTNQDSWTKEENKHFEIALAYYEEDAPDRWQKVARFVRTKTEEQVKRHYELLVRDIEFIENSKEPLVNYPSSSSNGRWRGTKKEQRFRFLKLQ